MTLILIRVHTALAATVMIVIIVTVTIEVRSIVTGREIVSDRVIVLTLMVEGNLGGETDIMMALTTAPTVALSSLTRASLAVVSNHPWVGA